MLTGDFNELDQLVRALNTCSQPIPEAVNRAAIRITADAREGYAQGVSPDGVKWRSNKDGSLSVQRPASEVEFVAQGTTIVGRAPEVLQYHEETRPVYPKVLPAKWDAILEEEATISLEKHFGGIE